MVYDMRGRCKPYILKKLTASQDKRMGNKYKLDIEQDGGG